MMPPKKGGKVQREAFTKDLECSIAYMLEQLDYYGSKEYKKAHY